MRAANAKLWAVLALLAIVACSGSSSPSASADMSTGGEVGSGGLTGTGTDEERLTDAQIFKVLDTLHAGRVAEGEAATVRASSEQVLDYAKDMISAHQEAGAAVTALEKQRSLVPADSKLSLTLAATSRVEVENLAGAASVEFDRMYVQAQVTDHGKSISVVESLLGMTTDAQLKTSLTALKTLAKDHQSRAVTLLSSL